MAALQTASFAATSVDYVSTNYVAVTTSQATNSLGSIPKEAQTMRLHCWSDASSGSATVRVVFRSKLGNNVVWADDATVTVLTTSPVVRQDNNGAGGRYLCSVAFASSGTNKLDLMPWRHANDDIEVKIGVVALSTIAALQCQIGWDEVA